MTAYYNEIDPKAAAWLRELIKQGHIAPGDVDETDIRDVEPSRLDRYSQCHFFAGIGGWSLALRLAGWPDDRPVWTGSCPCQPFSAAGARKGTADERHLWPHWHHLISQCQPPVVFGEQVASKDGLGWLDLVQADMEATGYAVAAQDICAAGVGAPHIRQRLWFVGLADADGRQSGKAGAIQPSGQHRQQQEDSGAGRLADTSNSGWREERPVGGRRGPRDRAEGRPARHDAGGGLGGLADADGRQRSRVADGEGRQHDGATPGRKQGDSEPERGISSGRLADASADGPQGRIRRGQDQGREAVNRQAGRDGADRRSSPTDGHWRDADWLFCRDGKWRPVEPSVQRMVDGLSNDLVRGGAIVSAAYPLAKNQERRVMRLRGYGNAIVPQVAAAWIEAVIEYEREQP